MNQEALRQFLVDSNKAGYAGGQATQWVKENDGSTTICFEKAGWRLHDNFFGGEPYGGRAVVFHEGQPVWIMVYYGWVAEGVEPKPIYGTLRNALMQMPEDHPFRGPREHKDGEHIYTNSWDGDLARFSGEERIARRGSVVYRAHYSGGLIDQRRAL